MLLLSGSPLVDTTIGFDDLPAGAVVTNQYADVGGAGQGVVFGRLPGGAGDGLRPVIRVPPAGQAQSGSRVAEISTCTGCEFYVSKTTGTFSVLRSRVSVYVGYLGPPAICPAGNPNTSCAFVTLTAFDTGGNPVAASTVRVVEGAGVHTQLSVSTPSATILGFEVSARDSADVDKQIAIDDLRFDTPSTPGPADFSITPATTIVNVVQGQSTAVAIAIGRLSGSSGDISFSASGLPAGVHGQFSPNPAGESASALTLATDADAAPTRGAARAVTLTGTPRSASAGGTVHSLTL